MKLAGTTSSAWYVQCTVSGGLKSRDENFVSPGYCWRDSSPKSSLMCCGASGSLLRKEEKLKSLESVYLIELLLKQL